MQLIWRFASCFLKAFQGACFSPSPQTPSVIRPGTWPQPQAPASPEPAQPRRTLWPRGNAGRRRRRRDRCISVGRQMPTAHRAGCALALRYISSQWHTRQPQSHHEGDAAYLHPPCFPPAFLLRYASSKMHCTRRTLTFLPPAATLAVAHLRTRKKRVTSHSATPSEERSFVGMKLHPLFLQGNGFAAPPRPHPVRRQRTSVGTSWREARDHLNIFTATRQQQGEEALTSAHLCWWATAALTGTPKRIQSRTSYRGVVGA